MKIYSKLTSMMHLDSNTLIQWEKNTHHNEKGENYMVKRLGKKKQIILIQTYFQDIT